MKILYLSHRIPYPPNKGDKIRSFNEIKYLSSSHEIHLACLADNSTDLKYKSDLGEYCKKVCVVSLNKTTAKAKSLVSFINNKPLSVGYFYSHSLQTTINHWFSTNSYDAIICFSSPMAEYLFRSPILKYRFSLRHAPCPMRHAPRLLMDFCDLDSDKWLQYSQKSRFPTSLVYRIESKLLLKYEKKINQYFDHSIFVSQGEANLFSRLYPEAKNVSVIPNGADYNYFSPFAVTNIQHPVHPTFRIPNSEFRNVNIQHPVSSIQHPATRNPQPILLFTGAMDYHANVDGVTWFCDRIFPMIKRDFPKSQFHIVGSNPHPKVRNLATNNGIKVTGFVEDIRPYYEAADVCVIPLRLARGVQNKVLEAMAMGKPVVTTTKAVEGIQAWPEEHVLVADTYNGFANAVLRLLKDQKARKQLGTSARKFVMKNYNWSTNMKKLETLLHGDQ